MHAGQGGWRVGDIIIIKAVVDVHIKCERLVHAAATTESAM